MSVSPVLYVGLPFFKLRAPHLHLLRNDPGWAIQAPHTHVPAAISHSALPPLSKQLSSGWLEVFHIRFGQIHNPVRPPLGWWRSFSSFIRNRIVKHHSRPEWQRVFQSCPFSTSFTQPRTLTCGSACRGHAGPSSAALHCADRHGTGTLLDDAHGQDASTSIIFLSFCHGR